MLIVRVTTLRKHIQVTWNSASEQAIILPDNTTATTEANTKSAHNNRSKLASSLLRRALIITDAICADTFTREDRPHLDSEGGAPFFELLVIMLSEDGFGSSNALNTGFTGAFALVALVSAAVRCLLFR